MSTKSHFEQALLTRFAAALGICAAVVPYAACGGKVVLEPGGEGGASSTSSTNTSSGVTTTSSSSVTGSSSSSSGTLPCDSTIGDPFATTMCVGLGPNGCPDAASAGPVIAATLDPCTCLMSVNGGPFVDPGGSCCYDTSLVSVCVIGRPFTRDQNIITAPARPGNTGWSARLTPDLSTLPAPLQKILAERRRGDALLEHASVASFARFSLSLMAAGAPAHLVEGAHQAALDEIRHAQLSFALASAYGGEMLTPGNMPLGPSVEVDTDLAKIARDAAIEGCIGETLASLLAAEQAAHATDPAVKQVFSQIAEDEARHAELAFQTIAWALKSGDARVWTALNEVFGNALDHLPRPPEDIGGPAELLEAHGEIGSSKARSALTHALFDVVLPCAQALLHQHRPEAVQPTVASFHIS